MWLLKMYTFCQMLLCAGFRRAAGGCEALPGGPEVGASLLPAEQPGQDGALSGDLGADRRPGWRQTQTKTGVWAAAHQLYCLRYRDESTADWNELILFSFPHQRVSSGRWDTLRHLFVWVWVGLVVFCSTDLQDVQRRHWSRLQPTRLTAPSCLSAALTSTLPLSETQRRL